MRVLVTHRAGIDDGREIGFADSVRGAGLPLRSVRLVDVYVVENVPALDSEAAAEFFTDTVVQEVVVPESDFYRRPWTLLIEVTSRPGVADPVVSTIRDALVSEYGALPADAIIQTARQILLDSESPLPQDATASLFHNPLVQQATIITRSDWDTGSRPPEHYPVVSVHTVPPVESIDIPRLSDPELRELSSKRLLALELAEMQAIRDYYADGTNIERRLRAGLGSEATDVELEMIAQTWSEHCKHKIFAAKILYSEAGGKPETIDGLFKTYIRDTTRQVAPDDSFVKSVFDDNAGVIAFDDETLVCFKAETHNSPSALDPYGGAITGIVGVNRDILGTGKGARPIFNTDVLCFGPPDTPPEQLPEGLLHPRRVLAGVHRGIVDGGNQSGIPVAAGAFLFDESYVGKPLVFCGTGGLLPAEIDGEASWIKHVSPGDLAVMVGGRIGKDGIHGATFSSLGLDESSPTSAVQIGEPITQRKMADFLLEARDRCLYCGITDNGAGGLSSSLGEMARESNGIRIDLDSCPLKYGGLAAWEILVSESQERMSLAVSPDTIDPLLALAARRGVEATVVGTFTDDGMVRIVHGGAVVGELSLEFLHDGLPQMVLEAEWPGRAAEPDPRAARLSSRGPGNASPAARLQADLLNLLSDPNIASKEHLVRQYDHEVQAASVIKPTCGINSDGPTDGAVLKPRYDSWQGLTVTHGIAPRYGDVDTYHMATAAVDEAVRAHVALGGDPGRMAALDNFCWPDPVVSESTPDGRFKLAQLVRACRGLADACREYRLPLISGKDSMKNDSYLGGRKVSIRPTLLVSLTGIVPDVRDALTTGFMRPGDRILLIGTGTPALGGSAYERLAGARLGDCPRTNLAANAGLYRAVHACIAAGLLQSLHDVSDGGLAVALGEASISGRLGARVSVPHDSRDEQEADAYHEAVRTLFGERTGTFVATCDPDRHRAVTEMLAGVVEIADIGEVTGDPSLQIETAGLTAHWPLNDLVEAWGALRHALDGVSGAGDFSIARPAGIDSVAARDDSDNDTPAVIGRTRPTAMLLTGYGINAERELGRAFEEAGAAVRFIHLNDLLADPGALDTASIFGLPGGFSYGDHVGSGLILAHRLRALRPVLDSFRASNRLILGICNGFQVLTKMGILPDLDGTWKQSASLVHNANGRFEDSWVSLEAENGSGSPWLAGIGMIHAPIRHGEGRFVADSEATLDRLVRAGRVAFRYSGRNPNGSQDDIAGIVDRTGNVLGMMPHPEAFLVAQNHPLWRGADSVGAADALRLFRNAVEHFRTV